MTNTPAEIERNFKTVAHHHSEQNWKEVNTLGPQVASALLGKPGFEFNDARRLSDLGIYLTDSGSKNNARMCFDSSIERLLNARKAGFENIEILDQLGMSYNNLARLLRKSSPHSPIAESYYRKSLTIFQGLYPDFSENLELGDRLGMAYLNLGNSLQSQKKTLCANETFGKCVRTYEEILMDFPHSTHLLSRLTHAKRKLFDVPE